MLSAEGANVILDRLLMSSRPKMVVGIEMQKTGVALVAKGVGASDAKLITSEYCSLEADSEFESTLMAWVIKHQLHKADCNLVLSIEDYQLLLVEPPDVPDEELRSAIRWRLKDLTKVTPDMASIDVFPLPSDGTKANKKMVYVVVAEQIRLKAIIDAVLRCKLNLCAIDIAELAMRNVVSNLLCDGGSERGTALVRLRQGVGSVFIYRSSNLYLARSFSLDYQGGLLDDLPQENIALEIQRSIDYYERQMGQAPPSVVYVCGENIDESKIGATLRASLSAQIQLLDPSAAVKVSEEDDPRDLQFCIGALGAAMRDC